MRKTVWMGLAVVAALAAYYVPSTSAIGKEVASNEAADIRGGACVPCSYGSCPAGWWCSADTTVVLGSGPKGSPYGSYYCGGTFWDGGCTQTCYRWIGPCATTCVDVPIGGVE